MSAGLEYGELETLDYNFYTALQQTSSSELTSADRTALAIAGGLMLIVLAVILLVAIDFPERLNISRHQKSYQEHEVLNAIAKASKVKAVDFQPGATVADIVEVTNLPVSRVVSILRRFKRYEIVKEGQNENGSKIYFV